MTDTTQLSTEARERLLRKITKRFGLEEEAVEEDALALHHDETFIKAIPNNFKLLFAFAGEHC